MQLPPMPKMPRMRASGSQPRKKGAKRGPRELDRSVMWREGKEEQAEPEHVYGTCAKCHQRKPAVDLTWRPDRMLFGEFHQGFWACRYECEEG